MVQVTAQGQEQFAHRLGAPSNVVLDHWGHWDTPEMPHREREIQCNQSSRIAAIFSVPGSHSVSEIHLWCT